jgi:hypothetical protein
MRTEALHVGMKVKHSQYGIGTVKSISEHTTDIRFDDQLRTISPESSAIEPAEPQVTVTALDISLNQLIRMTVGEMVEKLGLEKDDEVVEKLGVRWRNGTLVLRSADASLQPKEVPLETFFHKIVMMRNNLRVLEQKINGHEQLSDAEKFDIQQYITRCYGSMTTFNILFKNSEDQFSTKS